MTNKLAYVKQMTRQPLHWFIPTSCFLLIVLNITYRSQDINIPDRIAANIVVNSSLLSKFESHEEKKNRKSQAAVETIELQHCNCTRQLLLNRSVSVEGKPAYNETTCSEDAYARGGGQKVVAFSFYGSINSTRHKAKKYFLGIEENLNLLPEYYPGWVMRLYYDLDPGDPTLADLCQLACTNNNIDICNVKNLPGTPMRDARKVFAMNWRFFPTLDPQVDLLLSRDLDSLPSKRESAAVRDWLASGRSFHFPRDHPDHGTTILGGLWGWRANPPTRKLWREAWRRAARDRITWARRDDWGVDQNLLNRYVWPWGRKDSVSHDSYLCTKYPGTRPYPTQREEGPNNFVAAVTTDNYTLRVVCPPACRPEHHQDWIYC